MDKTVNKPLTETERREFGKQLLSQSVSDMSPNTLFEMFCNIKLTDYLSFLERTGLYYKRTYIKETLDFLIAEAASFPTLTQSPLTVGSLIFLAKLLYNALSENFCRNEQDEVNKIVVRLLIQPIAILTERNYHYE